ncbi:hypothetical protein B0P06_003471 [Clostridium saccharoperbutylacetonicum]|uniref:Cell wall binding repeat-containing protein n=1 Tax=Clostridium saccharoperbutylacetonicum N1-4(HMT) TaxID=931276 RepID=M1MU61_9CLOT|nr:hypothetical protein [Clostridium saccharoperbutylacetonicum]AGF58216.1 hypothetical protein Cspa_c44630 [Clostridium saccharoperbutylacetonicum N1-4(HMT)]NRT61009.1 hypothetical protein [Clostridium saccharoperbutylacetonicum]NSB24324.1 hypothetical protein [Clostridium saccharoperbutylacetonicum]NSB43700.1 hypothetical protein [Clostridium saccharoperbutylacetonicum]
MRFKFIRVVTILLTIASAITLNPLKANAEWKQDTKGWWYAEDTSWATGWKNINGEWYYFDRNGYMKTGWIEDEQKWYYLYSGGVMAKNVNINGYVLDSNGVWISSIQNNTSNLKNDAINNKQDVREIAFNQLTSQEKNSIKGSWQNGQISEITLSESMGRITDKSYVGKEVYIVNFPTNAESKPNNILVYIGKDNYTIVGYGYVD